MLIFQLTPFPLENHPAFTGLLSAVPPEAGGVVHFLGKVRNHNEGKEVWKLIYEAYAPLALAEGQLILEEAQNQFKVREIKCLHRVGTLEVGAPAVWITASADHRHPAFLAAEYTIDQIKKRVPIWKNEFYKDGSSSWVGCRHGSHHFGQ